MCSSILRLSVVLLALAACQWQAQAQAQAPAPAPTGPANLTGILDKAGQYTTFMRLLGSTEVGNQIANQVNTSTEGMTVFAPTDNAFQNLKPGTINSLTTQEQVQLVLYHVLPKFYSFDNFETVSNPVRTQATGNDGEVFGLTIVSIGNRQVNVSTGVVTTQLNNALREKSPLAVYQVDKVLLPNELFGAKSPKTAPASSSSPKSTDSKAHAKAETPAPVGASAADTEANGAFAFKGLGMTVVAVVGLITTALLF
ncbi:Fasciclin-like arabinogalactan protein 6 [Bienertia sinuspersici]